MPVFVAAFAWLLGKRQVHGHTFGIAHYLPVNFLVIGLIAGGHSRFSKEV